MGSTAAPNQRWQLAVLLTMLFMYQADATIVNVATPSIRADLGASGAELELVIGGYLNVGMLTRERPAALLLALLAVGGLGLGTAFSSILVHLTTAATPRYAADISGVFTTSLQIAGSIGVAAFGSLYLAQATSPGPAAATRAFGIVTATFAMVALIAAAGAHRATRTPAGQILAGGGA